jgi:hypothetical protein
MTSGVHPAWFPPGCLDPGFGLSRGWKNRPADIGEQERLGVLRFQRYLPNTFRDNLENCIWMF